MSINQNNHPQYNIQFKEGDLINYITPNKQIRGTVDLINNSTKKIRLKLQKKIINSQGNETNLDNVPFSNIQTKIAYVNQDEEQLNREYPKIWKKFFNKITKEEESKKNIKFSDKLLGKIYNEVTKLANKYRNYHSKYFNAVHEYEEAVQKSKNALHTAYKSAEGTKENRERIAYSDKTYKELKKNEENLERKMKIASKNKQEFLESSLNKARWETIYLWR
jgi:hypothetical protein